MKTENEQGIVRQGDVLLVPIDEVPFVNAREVDVSSRFVLAEGEATGHAHVVLGRSRLFGRIPGTRGPVTRCLLVEEPATLVHQEHDAIALAPGAYEIRRQREYVPPTPRRAATFRRVAD